MSLASFAGVFSRQFVVGYFVPWFVALLLLSQGLSSTFLPGLIQSQTQAASTVLIIGGAGLVMGLAAQGAWYPIMRLLEGYPLRASRRLEWLERRFVVRQRRRLARLETERREVSEALATLAVTPGNELKRAHLVADRRRLAWKRDRDYPPAADEILPTGFGNALRAFERYPNDRWGLDGIIYWPRIQPLLSDAEREIHSDAEAGVDFFINAFLVSGLAGVLLVADGVWHIESTPWAWLYRVAPFTLLPVFYRAAVN